MRTKIPLRSTLLERVRTQQPPARLTPIGMPIPMVLFLASHINRTARLLLLVILPPLAVLHETALLG